MTSIFFYEEDNSSFPISGTDDNYWVDWGNKERAIRRGSLWSYVNDDKTYLCPSDETGYIRTYSISVMMNPPKPLRVSGYYRIETYRSLSDCDNPSNTLYFIEENSPYAFNMWAFGPGTWNYWNRRLAGWHEVGINYALLDGSVGYRKWDDPRTPIYHLVNKNWRSHSDRKFIMDVFSSNRMKP